MSDTEKIKAAQELIDTFGNIDGSHHKQWVLSEVMKILMGDFEYREWRKARQAEGYTWDEGIAP